jgi:PLP dependent protein
MAAGLTRVRERVAAAAERSGRDPHDIVIVGVSKYAHDDAVRSAYEAGLRDFAENRAAELADRSGLLPGDARWHFVGRLQTNKVRLVRPVAHLLHSLDRPGLCAAWVKGPGAPPPVLVQVNVSGEPQKAGVAPEGAAALVETAASMGIPVVGLMTMAPLHPDPEASRPVFAELAVLRDRLRRHHAGVVELSMGMTDDFEVAVEEGATILRVGRAIFGASSDEGSHGPVA